MSIIPGTVPLTGKIAPKDSEDTYAVTDQRWGIDGLRNLDSVADLHIVYEDRRRAGMICGVLVGSPATDIAYYKLLPGPWTYDEADWEQLQFGSSIETTFDDFVENIFYNSLIPGSSYKFTYDLYGTGSDEYYFSATGTDSSSGTNGAKIYALESGQIMFIYLDSLFDTIIDQIYYIVESGGNLIVIEPGTEADPLVIEN